MRTLRRGFIRAAGFMVVAGGTAAVCIGMNCAVAQAQTPVPAQPTAKSDTGTAKVQGRPVPGEPRFRDWADRHPGGLGVSEFV